MGNELMVSDNKAMSVAEVKSGIQIIQRVLNGVMIKDVHYGVIKGCGNKPTLLKPGAEKIMSTFRLVASPRVEDMSTADCRRYRVNCDILTSNGELVGTGVGEASTDEEKYRWRAAQCDEEFNDTPETHRRIKYRAGYGGAAPTKVKQVRTEPADLANTVLKMAKKRALIDGVLTATAASDCFEQDLDEMEEVPAGNGKAAVQMPQQRAAAPASQEDDQQVQPASESSSNDDGAGDCKVDTGVLTAIAKPRACGKETKHSFKLDNDQWYATFSSTIAEQFSALRGKTIAVYFTTKVNGNFSDNIIEKIEEIEAAK